MGTMKVCAHCSTTFGPVSHLRIKFCSVSCANEARIGVSLKSKGVKRPHTQRSESRPCIVCKTEFRAVQDFAGKKPQQYCSIACWRRDTAIDKKTCLFCSTEFKPEWRSKVYCSITCRNEHYKTRLVGNLSPAWQGGKTSKNKRIRSTNEYKAWRLSVFKRDNWTCQFCGDRSAVGNPVELQADHILPLSERPDLACDIENGRTLCAPCHKLTDTWGHKQRWKNYTGRVPVHAVTGEPFPQKVIDRLTSKWEG